jgi:ubiquinone/menaquinone biosynthesis C-methylase UbiE
VLDLAGGTGSISLRTLRRLPRATTTLVDVDPVLLAIARSSVDERTTVVSADLRDSGWTRQLPRAEYDAVLTATALHWIDEHRLPDLYAEVRSVLRPGGVFINADHMPDPGLPGLNEQLAARDQSRWAAEHAADPSSSWEGWWQRLEQDPTLAPLVAERQRVFQGWHAAEFAPPHDWHLDQLRVAGFSQVGLIWRGLRDAAFAAVR